MSDSTNQGGSGGDFRGSREEKRQDETVMINSDNLSDMVSEAKVTEPTPGSSGSESKPLGTSTGDGGPNMLIIGIGVALILIVVIALVYEVVT